MLRLFRLAAFAAALAWTAGAAARLTRRSRSSGSFLHARGITDNVTRIVTQRIAEQTAGTSWWRINPARIPSSRDLAAKSAPDGYTFLTVIAAHAANATLYAASSLRCGEELRAGIARRDRAADHDGEQQLPGQGREGTDRLCQGQSGQDLLRFLRIGAAAHLTTELFKQTAGVDMVHIPYKGTAGHCRTRWPATSRSWWTCEHADAACARRQDQGAGDVFEQTHRRAQEVRPCPSRRPALEASTWILFLAPAGTPQDIVSRMSAEAAKRLPPATSRPLRGDRYRPVGSTPSRQASFWQTRSPSGRR